MIFSSKENSAYEFKGKISIHKTFLKGHHKTLTIRINDYSSTYTHTHTHTRGRGQRAGWGGFSVTIQGSQLNALIALAH